MFDVKELECKEFTSSRLGERAFSIKEVAKFLGVSIYEIRRDIKKGKLKACKPSSQYYIIESDLQKYIDQREDIQYIRKVLSK